MAQVEIGHNITRLQDFNGGLSPGPPFEPPGPPDDPGPPDNPGPDMAVVVVEHNITRLEPFNGAAPGTIVSDPGGGPGAAEVAGLNYEGAESLSRRINTTGSGHGFFYIHDVATDLTAAGLTVVMAKSYTVLLDLNSHKYRIGLTEPANFVWTVADDGSLGDDAAYLSPAAGGYIILPIEARKTAWITEAEVGSTTDITAIEGFGVIFNVGTTTGAGLSSSMDAIDLTDDGLFLTRGDSTDPDGTFQFFVDADEGAGVSGAERVGMWRLVNGVFFVFAMHTIGATDAGSTANPTVFVETDKTIVFPGGFVSEGFNGFTFDLTNNTTEITWTRVTMQGLGRQRLKRYFDTDRDVGVIANQITITGHDFLTGDQVIYSEEGGSDDIGPGSADGEGADLISTGQTTGDRWYIHKITDDTFSLHPTMADALADTAIETLTAATAPGENHSLTRSPDTRPDLDMLGAGTSAFALLSQCTFDRVRNLIMVADATYDDGQLLANQHLEVDGGQFNRNVINQPTVNIGEAYCLLTTSADLAGMDDNDWISGGEGHAIQVDTTGTTVGWIGNTFVGYGNGSATSAGVHDNRFDTGTNVDSGNDEITIAGDPFVTGDPVYYSDEGGSQGIGLTDNNLYYVRRTSANVYSFHTTFRAATDDTDTINLTSGGSETQVIYSANAAFWNDTGGTITLQISGGGEAPSIRNTSGSTTNVENNVSLTLSELRDNTEVRVFNMADPPVELAGVENATDGSSDNRSVTFSLAASLVVDIRFAHGIAADGNVYLVPDRNSIAPFTWPTTTTTLPITQIIDRNFNDPA